MCAEAYAKHRVHSSENDSLVKNIENAEMEMERERQRDRSDNSVLFQNNDPMYIFRAQ